ncbi:MAG TPA: hypothetical protein PLX97_08130 [Gemmatales bacterium]|nr:hypothetical protein [Gemmatales bacterium]
MHEITDNLSPVGGIEQALVTRIAMALWRLTRVVNYETAASAAKLGDQHAPSHQELAERKKLETELKETEQSHRIWEQERQLLRLLEDGDKNQRIGDVDAYRYFEIAASKLDLIGFDPHDPEFLSIFGAEGVMLDDGPDPYDVIQWQVSHLLLGVEYLAKAAGFSLDQALETLRTEICQGYEESKRSVVKLKEAICSLNHQHEAKLAQHNALHGMLNAEEIEKVCRYEGHLNRVLFSTLDQLQQLQSLRRQEPASLPAVAVGITLASSTESKHQGFILDDARLDAAVPRQLKQVQAIHQPIGC